jgi:hypothetical protein
MIYIQHVVGSFKTYIVLRFGDKINHIKPQPMGDSFHYISLPKTLFSLLFELCKTAQLTLSTCNVTINMRV